MGQIKSAGEETAKTDAKTETKKVQLPKGVDQKTMDMAMKIVESGYKANQEPDAIKSALFGKGITFSKLARIFNYASIQLGYEVDPKTVKQKTEDAMKNFKPKYTETFSELQSIAEKMAESIKGATSAKFISLFKKDYAEKEKEFPRKPATTRKRIGYINTTLIEMFNKNPKTTVEQLAVEFEKKARTKETAWSYARQYHPVCYAIANKLTPLQAGTQLAKEAEDK